MTPCFVYKAMGLTFHDRINTQLVYPVELAQVVARRITEPQQIFLGSNLGVWSCLIFLFFLFIFYFFLYFLSLAKWRNHSVVY